MKYEVVLSNRQCIFDHAVLETPEEVMSFVPGRGDKYRVEITYGSAFIDGESFCYDSDTNTYSEFNGWEWKDLSETEVKEKLENMVSESDKQDLYNELDCLQYVAAKLSEKNYIPYYSEKEIATELRKRNKRSNYSGKPFSFDQQMAIIQHFMSNN